MSALNPKVSLLVKLAQMADAMIADMPHLDTDPEVIEWLDRMAELKFIRQEIPETKPPEETP